MSSPATWSVPAWLLSSAALVLVGGLTTIMLIYGRPDRFRSTSRTRAFYVDFAPLLWSVVLLCVCGGLVLAAFRYRMAERSPVDRLLLPGFTASLIEDFIFFLSVGFVLVVIQRREFERGRASSDRIDTLFNAKKLSPRELQDLQVRIRESSCDFQYCEADVDIREVTRDLAGAVCASLDIQRKWVVASYLSDEVAHYEWKLSIKPDDVPNVEPLLQVFPSISRAYRVENGRAALTGAAKPLNPLTIQNTPEPYRYPAPVSGKMPFEVIKPGELREFSARYITWQRLTTPEGTPDDWTFNLNHHWDEFRLRVTNSLGRQVRAIVSAGLPQPLDLQAGERTDWLKFRDLGREERVRLQIVILG